LSLSTLTVGSAATFNNTTWTYGTGAAGAHKTALAIASGDVNFNSAITTNGEDAYILTTGANASIGSAGENALISTQGANATIDTSGENAHIYTTGANASIYTDGANAYIYTTGASAHIYTDNATAHIQTRSTFKIHDGTNTTTLSGTQTANRAIAFPDAAGTVALTSQTVLKSDYTPAHSLLVQQSSTGSPSSLSVGTNTILGRATGGGSNIAALTPSQARTVMELTALATTTPAANVATFLATPSSANLAAAVTDETGTGSLVFGTSPTLTTPTVSNNSASFTPISVGSGGTHVATFADNVNAVSGLQMGNVNTGIAADFRFLIKDTTDHYFAFSVPSTGNALTLFGLNRNATDYIFNTGGTARDMAIGTNDAKFLILATSATERLRVSATGEVGIGTTSPSTKALLEISSTTKGFLPPRMTTVQRDAITSVPAGLMIYNTTTNKLNVYTTAWEVITSA
jgi:hypothetical protein